MNTSKPGPKGPTKELIKLVLETKGRNPSYGCTRIALLVGNALGVSIDEETVRRISAKHYRPIPGNGCGIDREVSLNFLQSLNMRSRIIDSHYKKF